MTSTTPTLTYFATQFSNGHTRRVAVSLPYVACIADDPHYAAPLPPPDPEPPAMTRPSRWSEKLSAARSAKTARTLAQLRNQFAYAATVRQDRPRRRVNSRIVMVSDVSPRFDTAKAHLNCRRNDGAPACLFPRACPDRRCGNGLLSLSSSWRKSRSFRRHGI